MKRTGLVSALLALIVVMVLAAAGGALAWLLGTEQGLHWALERVRKAAGGQLAIEQASGRLASAVRIGKLTFTSEDIRFEAAGLSLQPELLGLLSGALALERLRAERVDIIAAIQQRDPNQPLRLALPVRVKVTNAEIASLSVLRGDARYAFGDIRFGYRGGPSGQRIEGLRARSAFGDVALSGSVAAAAPHALSAEAALTRTTEPYSGTLDLMLGGTLERLNIEARAQSAGLQADASGLLAPFAEEPLRSLRIRSRAIDLAAFAAEWPRTSLSVDLTARGSAARLEGSLAVVNADPGPLDRKRLPATRLATQYAADFGAVRLERLAIDLGGGGSLAGSARLSRAALSFDLKARALNLKALYSRLNRTSLSGPLQVTHLAPEQQDVVVQLSQDGMEIGGSAERRGPLIRIRALRAQANGGELRAEGQVRLAKSASFEASFRLARFDPARFGAYPEGNINGSGRISGALDPRRIAGQWSIAASRLRGLAFDSAGSARFEGNRLGALDATARLGMNRLMLRGAFGAPSDVLDWRIAAPGLAQLDAGISGELRAHGQLSGTLQQARVTFSLEGQNLARQPYAAQALSARGSFTLSPAERTVAAQAPFEVSLNGGKITARGFELERAALSARGSLAEHELTLAARALPLDAEARLRGGWHGAQGWSGRILALRQRGDYPLELNQPAPLRISAAEAALGLFQAKLGNGHLLVREARWAPGLFASSGEFRGLPAQWLIAPTALDKSLGGTLQLDGEWSVQSAPEVNGQLALRRASGDLVLLGPPQLDLDLRTLSLQARFIDSRIVARGEATTRLGGVALEGEIAPLPNAATLAFGARSALRFDARLQLADIRPIVAALQPLSSAQALARQVRLSGSVAANLSGRGTLGEPILNGTLNADGLGVDVPSYGITLRNGRLRAGLEGEQLRVADLSIEGGEGRLSATGILPLRFAQGGAQLDWRAEQFRLLNRPDMRLVASGKGVARFDGKRFALQGELRADRGELEIAARTLPQLGDDVVVVGAGGLAPRGRTPVPLQLDLQTELGDRISVRGRGFEGFIRGRLRLTTGDSGELRAQGRLQAAHATFQAYGERLQVDPGELFFDGPLDNPALQITAWRRNQEVEAGVRLTGTLKSPQVQLVSVPAVPEGDKLSWLVLGRAPGDAAGASLAILQTAAGTLLGRGGASVPITRRIAAAFGLDEFDVRGGGGLGTRVVAFGKRLTDRLYLSYEQGLGAAAENLVKLDLSLTRRLSLRAETGTASGIGFFYRYSWD